MLVDRNKINQTGDDYENQINFTEMNVDEMSLLFALVFQMEFLTSAPPKRDWIPAVTMGVQI